MITTIKSGTLVRLRTTNGGDSIVASVGDWGPTHSGFSYRDACEDRAQDTWYIHHDRVRDIEEATIQ